MNYKHIIYYLIVAYAILLSPALPVVGKEDQPSLIKEKDHTELNKGISGQVSVIDIVSDELSYDDQKNAFTAVGSAKVVVPSQNSLLEANEIIYYQDKEFLTAKGNVSITRDGNKIKGEFIKIFLDRKSVLIDDPSSVINKINIKAKEAMIEANTIHLQEGQAVLEDKEMNIEISSNEYKSKDLRGSLFEERSKLKPNESTDKPRYKIYANHIELDKTKKFNNLMVSNAKVYIGNIKIATVPKISLTVGEGNQPIKMIMPNIPEVGFNDQLGGAYLGPHVGFELPNNAYVKLAPLATFGGDRDFFGYGGLARYNSFSNSTLFGYSSGEGKPFLRGYQEVLSPHTKLKYNINSYIDNGFLGEGIERPQYIIEAVDERRIAKLLNHNITTRIGSGFARDGINSVGTFRFQYQTEIISDKPLLSIGNIVDLRLQSQFNISAYGTGDALTVVRGGPRIDWDLGRLALTTSYFQAGVWGDTPFTFDQYTRGTSNLVIGGDVKVTDHLNIGSIQSLNLREDGGSDKFSSENQVYAKVGPSDFKVSVGYDFVRKRSTFGVDLLVGAGRAGIGFKELDVKQ